MKLKFTILASLLVIVGFVPWMVQGQSGGGSGGGGLQVGSGATTSEKSPGSSSGGSSGASSSGLGSSDSEGGAMSGGMSGPQGGGLMGGRGGMGGMGGGMGGMGGGSMGDGGMGGMGGGGMGGMGGGGMGGGGMGGMGYGGMGGMPQFELQQWQKPVGREPAWLANGRKSIKLQEELRDRLNEEIEVDFPKLALVELVDYMREKLEIQTQINLLAIQEDEALQADSEIAPVRKFSGPVRDFLRRTLEPFKLTYRVHENYVEITSTNMAESYPIIRYYDLSYVLDNNSLLNDLINTIQSSIEPDSWVSNGGTSSIVPIGNLLVISSTETNHLEIERLLAQLARRSQPSNDSASVEKKQPAAAVADPFGAEEPAVTTETIRK